MKALTKMLNNNKNRGLIEMTLQTTKIAVKTKVVVYVYIYVCLNKGWRKRCQEKDGAKMLC